MQKLIARLRQAPEWAEQIVHYRHLPPAAAQARPLDDRLPAELRGALQQQGIGSLFSHQAEALELLRAGRHTGVTTPTASGKTLIYNLAVTEKLIQDPSARALYLFPLKALAQDQLKTLQKLFDLLPGRDFSAAIYDGDTPASARGRIKRKPPRVIITNPDMLHYGLLAFQDGWRDFFRQVRFVVLDEAHTYRGIFGSHVSLILRRLRRLCGEPGPVFVSSSATMANAREFLGRLTGLDHVLVEASGAPRQGRHVLLVQPQASPYTAAAGLLQECLEHKIKTILFTKSRKITELISLWVQEGSPRHAGRIAAYRSGYLPEDRRDIERRLFSDELAAVISTSALESGIDVGGLDACILVGYPGTMISTWQRVGRAGRQAREALMILVALPDALDYYFLRNPDALFSGRFENCVLDPANTDLLMDHLPCAAAEEALTPADWELFGPEAEQALPALLHSSELHEAAEGERWVAGRRHPHRDLDIRTVGEQYVIKLEPDGRVLGTIDSARVFKECHPGAIYLHAGVSYEVSALDFNLRTVMLRESDADWYTQYTASEEVEILDLPAGRGLSAPRHHFTASLVHVRVTERIVSYERHRLRDQGLLSEHKLTLPPRIFETRAVLLTVPDQWRRRCLDFSLDFSGGLHAAEHVLIAALPVHVLCERWDVGGLSTASHPQVDQPCIFIYDGYPGGVGLAAKGLQVLPEWIATARDIVSHCDCEEGCPICIHSPKCGSRNQPLDKQACQLLLKAAGRKAPEHLKLAPAAPAGEPPLDTPRPAVFPRELPPVPSGPGEAAFQVLVFDLETQKSAAEVGGWDMARNMRMSVGVVYDFCTGAFTPYRENQAADLIQRLLAADLVVGFNLLGFDWKVLSAYSPYVPRIRTFDILAEIRQSLGHRLSLDHLARNTLGRAKTAEGLQAIQWFQTGNWRDLEAYCQSDVEITRDILLFGLKYHYVLFERDGRILKQPVDWGSNFPPAFLRVIADTGGPAKGC